MLKFIDGSTMSVERWKSLNGAERVDVSYCEQNNSYSMTVDGIVVGACSKAGAPSDPVISRVIGDDGVEFTLIHERPNYKPMEVVASF